mmetsp:Transcript_33122/g.69703  ORF Transcript_33122/g.69703 Transcript_33122/m.69703 type:complete len:343 (-) Transcript_33122:245-1273(-)
MDTSAPTQAFHRHRRRQAAGHGNHNRAVTALFLSFCCLPASAFALNSVDMCPRRPMRLVHTLELRSKHTRRHRPLGLLDAASAEDKESRYAPFVALTMDLLEEAGVQLQEHPLDDAYRHKKVMSGSTAKQVEVALSTKAFSSSKLRSFRFVEIVGGPNLQVLNLCLFPRLEFGLPTFSADLVTLPGGHLIAIDCQPNGLSLSEAVPGCPGIKALDQAFLRHRELLPEGGPVSEGAKEFFSPNFIFTRFPLNTSTAELRDLLLPAYEDYFRAYMRLLEDAKPLCDPFMLEKVLRAQMQYAKYRSEKDPARGMLTRLFGSEYTEGLIDEVLFDLPLWLKRHDVE